MTFYFAWVDPGTAFNPAVHSVEDEDVFAFEIVHTEGDFPMLAIDIKNPRVNLLGPGRDLWAWLSQDGSPLFFGRLVALPEDTVNEIVRLNFIARPQDYDAQKATLAASLRVPPYWDEIWIREQLRDDPDVVLEARAELWHVDRISHILTTSNIIAGEDGTVSFGVDEIFYSPIRVTYGAAPLRRVKVDAKVSWDQQASGTLDFTKDLLKAAKQAGSPLGVVSSYTGQGLQNDWPRRNDNFSGGWSVGPVRLKRVDGRSRPRRSKRVSVDSANPVTSDDPGSTAEAIVSPQVKAEFFVWEFVPHFPLEYNVKRKRVETMTFTLEADVQNLVVEPGEDEAETITLSTKVGEPDDPTDPYATIPIEDLRRRSYFITDRGLQSVEYLILLARAHLLARARAVQIEFTIPFASGINLSCRKSVTLTDPRLPGGTATGKIKEYRLQASGDGSQLCTVKIGCTIGLGNTVTATVGVPSYVEDNYVELGYQMYDGATIAVLTNQITYNDFRGTPINDDGIDFQNLSTLDVINEFTVMNGETAQAAVLSQRYPDIPAAIEALNAVYTQVKLDLKPLTGGPFQTDFQLVTSELMIPKTIDL